MKTKKSDDENGTKKSGIVGGKRRSFADTKKNTEGVKSNVAGNRNEEIRNAETKSEEIRNGGSMSNKGRNTSACRDSTKNGSA